MSRLFSLSTDKVSVAASPSINSLPAFTQAVWAYPISNGGNHFGTLFVKDPAVTYTRYAEFSGTDNNTVLVAEELASIMDATSNSSVPLALNAWSRIVTTFDINGDGLFHIYINGIESTYDGTTTASGTVTDDSAGPFVIGNDSFADNWDGYIALAQMWNVALTAAQVAADYAGTALLPGNLVDSLTFLTDQGSTEPDASGNGNVGVITGATFSSMNPPQPTPPVTAYSVPDCRNYGNFPNDSVDVNGTLTYTVPSVDSRTAGAPVDSRAAGAPVACGTYPQNSRTPGVYGPGEN